MIAANAATPYRAAPVHSSPTASKEFPAMSQGRARAEARDKIRNALRELLLSHTREGAPAPIDAGSTGEPLELTISP
jgi:hypothetical protein